MKTTSGERLNGVDALGVTVGRGAAVAESLQAHGRYEFTCRGPREEVRDEYNRIRVRVERIEGIPLIRALASPYLRKRRASMEMMTEEKWRDSIINLVVTQGKNYLLDNGMAGSGYTAAFYLGLVSSVGFSAYAAGDTAAQIDGSNGWKEAGLSNAPTYSQATRPSIAWSAAVAGSKTTSAPVVFTITGIGTIKGAFAVTVNTKEGTTGSLFSAGNFVSGDKVVGIGDTVNATYALSV